MRYYKRLHETWKSCSIESSLKKKNFLFTFRSLGQASEIEDTAFNELEQFVCCMYGKPKYSSVNKLRYDLFIQKYQPASGSLLSSGDGVDLSPPPPCRDSLYMHIKRANYQTLLLNSTQERFPDIPEPIGHGWTTDDKGKLTYDWTYGDIMPQELTDIIGETELGEENVATDSNEDGEIEKNDNMNDYIFADSDDE